MKSTYFKSGYFAWAVGLALAAPALAQTLPAAYQAVAVNLSNVGQTGILQLDVRIERWTDESEFGLLRDTLLEKGSDGLLRKLQDMKRVGTIRAATGGLAWDLHFARRNDLPGGGYRVVFATDRPMSFYERTARPLSADYEFLLGELRIGPEGSGEGKLVPRAKVTYNKGSRAIEIENYANEPVRLTKVTELKPHAN
jgi:hypothetical protein